MSFWSHSRKVFVLRRTWPKNTDWFLISTRQDRTTYWWSQKSLTNRLTDWTKMIFRRRCWPWRFVMSRLCTSIVGQLLVLVKVINTCKYCRLNGYLIRKSLSTIEWWTLFNVAWSAKRTSSPKWPNKSIPTLTTTPCPKNTRTLITWCLSCPSFNNSSTFLNEMIHQYSQ